ncbi:MAG: hypothetical protein KF709_03855 [Gemmatimonadaceae bacterium]|nr:hypothetical protein [Gemmatimonadaceae bacterium]
MTLLLYLAAVAVLVFGALRYVRADEDAEPAPRALPIVPLGWALSLFLAITYLACIVFDLAVPGSAMRDAWSGLLPGFVWLTPTGFALGLLGSLLYGWYIALLFGGLYNAIVRRTRTS